MIRSEDELLKHIETLKDLQLICDSAEEDLMNVLKELEINLEEEELPTLSEIRKQIDYNLWRTRIQLCEARGE